MTSTPPVLVLRGGAAGAIPTEYALEQNYPNPFNPATTIRYALPAASHVRLTVYNLLGQEIVSLVDGPEEAGYKTVTFDASVYPSGIYIYRLTAGAFSEARKMLIMR